MGCFAHPLNSSYLSINKFYRKVIFSFIKIEQKKNPSEFQFPLTRDHWPGNLLCEDVEDL